ncbi:MAG: hypothetical protein ABEI99_03235 [Halobaculum sp.]
MSVIDTIRRPEYTGENRCTPCTVLNVGIVAVVGLLAGLLTPILGVVIVAVGFALVALRGYVVPYTPTFAPKIAARLPITFDHGGPGVGGPGGAGGVGGSDTDADPMNGLDDAGASGDAGAPDGEAVTRALIEGGVLTGSEELHLDPGFEDDWLARIRDLRESDGETLAERVAEAAQYTDEARARGDAIQLDGPNGVTLRRPVAILDTATVEALAEFGIDREFWQPATRPLRLFLSECPDCGGSLTETTQAECCGGAGSVYGSLEDDVLACADCGAVVYRFGGDAEPSGG